jgi:nucleotide-binding universal stress UspA family protein
MAASDSHDPAGAAHDFRRARNRAKLRDVLHTLVRGDSPALMSYEEVRRKLRAIESQTRELVEVPLDAITGSVGRYNDFNRQFLPLHDSDETRWTAVRMAMTGMAGVPPVELYRIGDAYFVKDGNHRVSVARQLGSRYIHAYVTPLHARVPLEPDTSPDELIIKAEYAEFLEDTRLDELRPGLDLTVTVPGQYGELREHISVHRYFMGEHEKRAISREEAVTHWYDTVYLPVIDAIRRHGLLRGFEGRTETDLYLWVAEHRGKLWRQLGFSLPPETIVSALGPEPLRDAEERTELLQHLRSGQEPESASLGRDLLVALTGKPYDFETLEQALIVARREGSRLYGLQMIYGDGSSGHARALRLQPQFEELCAKAGIEAQFVIAGGKPVDELLERAIWSDLVITRQPAGQPPGFRRFLRRSPRPMLITGDAVQPLDSILLAFDGSRRSREALFIVTYLAAKWGSKVAVVTIGYREDGGPLEQAREYLESFGVKARYVAEQGPVAERIVATADTLGCDLIALGSYKYSPWLETMLGSVPEEVLALARHAVLIV